MVPFVNRQAELMLIDSAFEALRNYGKDSLLLTPIIDFFGVAGMGKTVVLEYIKEQCEQRQVRYILIDANQNASHFSREIVRQLADRYDIGLHPVVEEEDLSQQSLEAIKALLEQGTAVMILDSVDATNEDLLERIAITLRDVINDKKLFVVLASKRGLLFNFERSISRQLTSLQLMPLDRKSCERYFDIIEPSLKPEIRQYIFDWTHGYPLAMKIMTMAITEQKLDPAQPADQKALAVLLVERVIGQNVLAKLAPSEQNKYKEVLTVLSVPRHFNLLIMQKLIEHFVPEMKRGSGLAYMGLPMSIKNDTDILNWNTFRGEYTIDLPIRNIFLLKIRIEQTELYSALHQFLAQLNKKLASTVTDSDHVRYLCEYLYHSAYVGSEQEFTQILEQVLFDFTETSFESFESFEISETYLEELLCDSDFKKALGERAATTQSMVYKYLADVNRRESRITLDEEHLDHLRNFFIYLVKDPAVDVRSAWTSAIRNVIAEKPLGDTEQFFKELLNSERLEEALKDRFDILAKLITEISLEGYMLMEHGNGNRNETFVGREGYKEEFIGWLTRRRDSGAPWILSIYDALTDPSKQGGVGKTRLLDKFSDIAKQTFPKIVIAHVDFFNIADRDGIAVAQRVVAALKDAYPAWNTSNTQKILDKYSSALRLQRQEEITEARNIFADALIADFHVLNEKLNATDKHLLIFFDTFEHLEENPLTAVLRLDQAFPDDYDFSNIGVVIAGRHKIDFDHSNWRGREDEVQSMPVSPFTPSEIKEYFVKLSNVDISRLSDNDIQALHDRTEGRPILIGLVNDVLNQRRMTMKELISTPKPEFDASLVGKICELGLPIDRIILVMAHAYHRFNFSLLKRISPALGFSDLQDVDLEKRTQQLLSLSFVRRPSLGEDFVLHDEMRPLVNRYGWAMIDPERHLRTDLSRLVMKYYEDELQHIQSEQLKQAYTVELLYHKLYVDLGDGYTYFSEHFSRAVNLRLNSFSRALLYEVQQFKKQMSPTQLYDLKFCEARLLQKEEDAARALNLFLELEQEADQQWLEGHRADIFFEKGVAHQQLSRYSEAIESFTSSMHIEKARGNMSDYAYILNWIGSVHQKQGHLDMALRYYEEGLDIHNMLHNKRACATALLSISNVYQLQGKVEEALRRAKTCWHIRNELFKQGEMSEVYVGWSHCTIGTVYYQISDFPKANDSFQDAYDIFTRTGYKKGLATIYNRLGKLSMDQGALPYAQQWFKRAHSMSLNIDAESQINSLNKLGGIFVLQEQYEKAIDFLQQAIDLAKEVHDDYQQAESLVDLAEAFKRSGQDERSQRVLQEARQICLEYNYYYLLAISSSSEGDIFYEAHKYKEAFVSYGEACYYMTQYNRLEYNKVLRKLIDNLLETPPNEINSIVDELVAYWSSHELGEDYADFISACEEVRGLLGL